MGGAIGANLVKKGNRQVLGYDPSENCRKNLIEAGGRTVETIAEIGKNCPFIILALPSVAALEEDLDIILPVASPGTILLECSTFPVNEKIRLNKKLDGSGIVMLDTPLSGTGAQAKKGDLSVFISGDSEAAAKVIPIVEAFARSHYYLGEFGNGMKMKCVANLLVAIHNQSTAEALLLGTRYGLPAQLIYDAIFDSAGSSKMFQVRGPMMVKQQYKPASMTNELFKKDLQLIHEALKETGVHAPLFEATLPVYQAAQDSHGDDDTGAVYAILEKMSR
jgi:3-hydroxyisobutyrate dehydrogenase-like beta-hydroxyacid dehydrogenase